MDNIDLLNYLAFTLDNEDDLSARDISYIANFIITAKNHIDDKNSVTYIRGVVDGYVHALAYHGSINIAQLLDFDVTDAILIVG